MPSSTPLILFSSEDCNMSYLLHHVESSGSDSGSNPANEAVIDVDYDALEASVEPSFFMCSL